jgi:hypothetical protein
MQMEIDNRRLLESFQTETKAGLEQMEEALLELETHPDDCLDATRPSAFAARQWQIRSTLTQKAVRRKCAIPPQLVINFRLLLQPCRYLPCERILWAVY